MKPRPSGLPAQPGRSSRSRVSSCAGDSHVLLEACFRGGPKLAISAVIGLGAVLAYVELPTSLIQALAGVVSVWGMAASAMNLRATVSRC